MPIGEICKQLAASSKWAFDNIAVSTAVQINRGIMVELYTVSPEALRFALVSDSTKL